MYEARAVTVNCPEWCETDHTGWHDALLIHRTFLYEGPDDTSIDVSRYEEPDNNELTIWTDLPAHMTPALAREIADKLRAAADIAETSSPVRPVRVTIAPPTPDQILPVVKEHGFALQDLSFLGTGAVTEARLVLGDSSDPVALRPHIHLYSTVSEDEARQIIYRAEEALESASTVWRTSYLGNFWETALPLSA